MFHMAHSNFLLYYFHLHRFFVYFFILLSYSATAASFHFTKVSLPGLAIVFDFAFQFNMLNKQLI